MGGSGHARPRRFMRRYGRRKKGKVGGAARRNVTGRRGARGRAPPQDGAETQATAYGPKEAESQDEQTQLSNRNQARAKANGARDLCHPAPPSL